MVLHLYEFTFMLKKKVIIIIQCAQYSLSKESQGEKSMSPLKACCILLTKCSTIGLIMLAVLFPRTETRATCLLSSSKNNRKY